MTELYVILFALRKLLFYPSSSFVIFTLAKFPLPSTLPLYYSPFSLLKFKSGYFAFMPVKRLSVFVGFRAMLALPAMNVLTHWPILLLYYDAIVSRESQPMIISILFTPFYLAVDNPSGLISQIINFVQLNHPSLLGQTQVTRIDGGRLHLHDYVLATLTLLTLIL